MSAISPLDRSGGAQTPPEPRWQTSRFGHSAEDQAFIDAVDDAAPTLSGDQTDRLRALLGSNR